MNDLENRLRHDARPLRAASSNAASSELANAIANDIRERQLGPRSRFGLWLGIGLPLAVAATALWFMTPAATVQGPVETLAVAQPDGPSLVALSPIDIDALETVSSSAPLEAEWDALMQDLERAKTEIQKDLPINF